MKKLDTVVEGNIFCFINISDHEIRIASPLLVAQESGRILYLTVKA